MGPQARNGQKNLSVCLVEYNPLAAHRLRQLLETDPRLRLTFQDDASRPKRVSKTLAPVFVLDRGTLPTPLSKFLRVLHVRFRDAKTLLLGAPVSNEELSRLSPTRSSLASSSSASRDSFPTTRWKTSSSKPSVQSPTAISGSHPKP